MQLSNKIQELFLKGGKVVYQKKDYILIRMPKNNFIQPLHEESRTFEYIIAHPIHNEGIITIGTYLNATLRKAKKIVYDEYIEDLGRKLRNTI